MSVNRICFFFAFLLMAGLFGMREASASSPQSIIIVNGNGDNPDAILDGVCDTNLSTSGNQCSLRAAIQEANHNPSDDIIRFVVPLTIILNTDLPKITDTVTINGIPMNGSSCPTDTTPASLNVTISGNPDGTSSANDGLSFDEGSSSSVVKGLRLINFPEAAIRIRDSGGSTEFNAHEIKVGCNHIGFLSDNTPAPNKYGIHITGEIIGFTELAGNHQIGGTSPDQRNVISGNSLRGIYLSNKNRTTITNNYIGTAPDGVTPLGNIVGIETSGGNNGGENTIGTEDHPNTIAHNTLGGVWLRNIENAVRFNKIFDNAQYNIQTSTTEEGDEEPDLNFVEESGYVSGTLWQYPPGDYVIDVYQSIDCLGPTGGQGRTHVGTVMATVTSAAGGISFGETLPTTLEPGYYYAYTSSIDDFYPSTSEFSNCYLLPGVPPTAIGLETQSTSSDSKPLAWVLVVTVLLVTLSGLATATKKGSES